MKTRQRIAIVGIGGVFPGARNVDQFWDNILNARDLSREPPQGRWLLPLDEIWQSKPGPDKVYSRRACFVDDFLMNLEGLDIDGKFLETLDPMYRLLLQAGRDAWFDAVTDDNCRERAGVIIGNIALPTDAVSRLTDELLLPQFESQLFGRPGTTAFSVNPLNRYVAGLPAGLLARALGLGGGSYTLDAACASSLYAVKYAADELSSGRADIMLAGGLSRPDSLYTQMGFSALTALSPSGRCAPFDKKADGLVVGEGCGMVVLKRLEDALSAGDHIYALITGIGLSNDIGGNLMAPDSEGQLRAMHAAYEQAQWQPKTIDLMECHGTGTPVGDATEFKTLMTLWDGYADEGRCVIGSVKSNIGHLLTAAGAAGLIKVLQAMKHRCLPPTANFEVAPPGIDLTHSPFTVLGRPEAWHARTPGTPLRAALSAFGFGGINAHVLLEEWIEGNTAIHVPAPLRREDEDIAVIGMDTGFGPWRSLDEFRDRIFALNEMEDPPLSALNGWGKDTIPGFGGWFIDELSIPVGRFRIPPTELKDMLPQQLLMLLVATNALDDAGIGINTNMLNTGVYIGIGLDLNTTNFHLRWKQAAAAKKWIRQIDADIAPETLQQWIADLRDAAGPCLSANRTMGALGGIVASRIARACNVGGPSFTLSNEEASGVRSLLAGVRALQRREIDLAITGAVDLAGDIRSVLAQDATRSNKNPTSAATMDHRPDRFIIGEGAAAMILKRHTDALRDGDRIYALIKGVGDATGGAAEESLPAAGAYRKAVHHCLGNAGVSIDSIGYVDINGSSYRREDAMESHALKEIFSERGHEIPAAIGNCKADIGHAGAAGGMAALVKACLCLHYTTLPALRNTADSAADPNPNILFAPAQPQYWLRNRKDGPRRALVNTFSIDGNCISAVLEGVDTGAHTVYGKANYPLELFTLAAGDNNALLVQLHALEKLIPASGDIRMLAARWWREQPHDPELPAAIGLLAASGDELRGLISEAGFFVRELQPAKGQKIFYKPAPRDKSKKVAFVFPGSGNHFLGMGRESALFRKDVIDRLDMENDYLAGQFAATRFWREAETPAFSHEDVIFGQVWLGTLMSDIIAGFGIKPDAVIGYSLGETAGLFATRAWRARDLMLRRIRNSTLFTRDLGGSCEAARKVWGLGSTETVDWQVGMVDRSAAEVSRAVAGRQRVYLLIINTPGECVVGGDRVGVAKLVADLKCNFHPISGVTTVHCEVVKPVAQAYRELHLFPTTPPMGVTFYSGIRGGPYEVTTDSAADSIVGQALHFFDYTRVINSAWEDGVRIFIEMGPGATCTRMIDNILGDRPHIATPLCVKGQSETLSILRMLAQLHAEHIPVDLSALYGSEPIKDRWADHQKISIPVGRKSLNVPQPPESWLGTRDLGLEKTTKQHEATSIFPRATSHEPRVPKYEIRDTLHVQSTPEATGVQDKFNEILQQARATESARAETQAQFLKVANGFSEILGELQAIQSSLMQSLPAGTRTGYAVRDMDYKRYSNSGLGTRDSGLEKNLSQNNFSASTPRDTRYEIRDTNIVPRATKHVIRDTRYASRAEHPEPLFNRDMCLEFATGSIEQVLGTRFAEADHFPTRVRLPDEPLMLVDRILAVEGEPVSMTRGRVITEHDVRAGAWYLDCGRIPTCVAVEAGQADLFLCAYLGIDLRTRGLAMYRLLDAEVTFHGPLPHAGQTIQYDIHIEHFFLQGDTWLFRFHFDGSIDGKPLISMRNGCAGFFTCGELEAGRGIVQTSLEQQPQEGKRPPDWNDPAPMRRESYSDAQLDALRKGRLSECFGVEFTGLPLRGPVGLPAGRMTLVHRVLNLDPAGGRFGIGQITGEADIHHDDWFLTCHFVDDQVMPGTLMYECCLHTLRIYLLRMGWVGEAGTFVYEPVPGISSRLKCRGQVTAVNRRVQYEISLKEYGYHEDGTPYVIADALMYADGRAIVQMIDMSLQLSGLTRQHIEELWSARRHAHPAPGHAQARHKAIYDHDSILAFATGKPSVAFGERYRIFDNERVIARLPGPPFQFLDRIVSIRDCRQWELAAGGVIEAQYDVPQDAWYFLENRQPYMPFSILLEVALQPCGWLAAYLGSALSSDKDLSFRNLGGTATQYRMVAPDTGTLHTMVKITDVSRSGGMIIQHFEFDVSCEAGPVYQGSTYFGFFTRQALANQIGIREARLYRPSPELNPAYQQQAYPDMAPYPAAMMRMIDTIELFDPAGAPQGLDFIQGTAQVDPGAWFFKAHFYQDPVWPGSLGLESLIQLLKVTAMHHWGESTPTDIRFESMGIGEPHEWIYRGQILPGDNRVDVQAIIKHLNHEDKTLSADGFLSVDGRIIYQMTGFTLKLNH